MGCGSTEIKLEGQVIKQETIYLDISNHYKNKELTQAQNLIHLITHLRNKIIYEYDNLIYKSGACLFKNPRIAHCTKCIFFKMSTECKGELKKDDFTFREDPPFLKFQFERFSKETNILLNQLFDFIIMLRDYKIILKQIDKETPKLMYIIFENNNKISKENIEKINKSISLFKELYKLRNNILFEYKNQIYDLMTNEFYVSEINTIGEKASRNNMTDIYEIGMLFKENNTPDIEWAMYGSINEAKKKMEKKLKNEKVDEIDTSFLTFSITRAPTFDTCHESYTLKNENNL